MLNKQKNSLGRPALWNEEKVLKAVQQLCKNRYVDASHFPPALYKACKKYCGTLRRAKWKAKILNDRHWNYEKFIASVQQYCLKEYKNEKDWPKNLRALAKKYCGSVRKAKWEAGIIIDIRKKKRKKHEVLKIKWTKEKFLNWVWEFCRWGYQKPESWPNYMRELAVRYCSSVRAAKWEAKILQEQRKNSRKFLPT
ncbi:MAG: hypothetical protein HYT97_00050 [Elusimicrobia bacterium]|nr:hypothetical protein [Elusimicrobiota bacterium]